ncbi:MAG: GGDEF domain-containing protein [Armatimonadetes bacterium]|nr:GGDEF domain-containing protein [Armatimonadota bacterium]
MNDQFLPQGDELVPALRTAGRVLCVWEHAGEKGGRHLNGRARAVSAMKRLADVAETLGHIVASASEPSLVEEVAPEVVLVDGSSHHAVALLQNLRSDCQTASAFLLAVVPARARDDLLESLRAVGADDFLSADAQHFEVQARLEAAATLIRARAEIARLRDHLSRQARVDDLTGVMSRRFFFQQAHRECSRARRYGHKLSCVMIEIDHFKSLSVTFGEAAGECVLRATATIIGQWTRDSDLVARFTESKFVVLLPETDIGGATRAQDKIAQALASHRWLFESGELPVSVSIGESELQAGAAFHRVEDDYISEGEETGDGALSTREALAGLLEDADAALSVARKGARMPEVFVPYTAVPASIERGASAKKRPKRSE